MRSALTLIQILNFADWIIAAFIAGTAVKIEGRDATGKSTGKRTALAVGLAVFFTCFALWRLSELVNLVAFGADLRACLGLVPEEFNRNLVLISGAKTATFLFCWFAVTLEVRERKGITSGNVIRNFLARQFEKLK